MSNIFRALSVVIMPPDYLSCFVSLMSPDILELLRYFVRRIDANSLSIYSRVFVGIDMAYSIYRKPKIEK